MSDEVALKIAKNIHIFENTDTRVSIACNIHEGILNGLNDKHFFIENHSTINHLLCI